MAITNIGNLISQQALLKALRQDVNEANRLATTGKKSTTIAGMGASGASTSVALRNTHNLFDTYMDNLNTAKARFQIMDHAFLSVTEDVRDMTSGLRSLIQGADTNAGLMRDKAETLLTSVLDKMNVQYNGRYLFSGDDIYSPAFDDRAALDGNISTMVAGWMAGTPSAGSVAADARTISNTDLGISAEAVNAGRVTMRVDQNLDIDFTIKANQSGFPDVLRGLAIIANLTEPTTPAEVENYWAIVNGAIQIMDAGAKELDATQGFMGQRAKMVDELFLEHKNMQGTYEMFISDVEDVDMADASLRLQDLMRQMEASMTVIAQSRNLSLVNYL